MADIKLNYSSYLLIPAWALEELDLDIYELHIFSLIHSYSRDKGCYFQGSRDLLAKWSVCKITKVHDSLKKLLDEGLIIKETYKDNCKDFPKYKINENHPKIKPFITQEKIYFDTVRNTTDTVRNTNTLNKEYNKDNNKDNSKEKRKEKKKKENVSDIHILTEGDDIVNDDKNVNDDIIVNDVNVYDNVYINDDVIKCLNDDIKKIVLEWLNYKKTVKKFRYTDIGLKKLLPMMIRISDNNPVILQEIVDRSIANNYDGLFPLKDYEKQKLLNDNKSLPKPIYDVLLKMNAINFNIPTDKIMSIRYYKDNIDDFNLKQELFNACKENGIELIY